MTRRHRAPVLLFLQGNLEFSMHKHAPDTASNSRDRAEGDRRHDSDRRGEHRYPDTDQRPAERLARQERDDLKERLTRSKSGGKR
jgi:hypothetical protein